MRDTMDAAPRGTLDGIVWAQVEPGFHVGSRDGDFLGYIDRRDDGQYLAWDMTARVVGRFPDLASAIRVLSERHPDADARGEGGTSS
ncbi:hypothetical protein CVS47_02690 [Microbacterium lemovicicum]|uniref:Uncharacterized protein n=1 Tax=Microbacterium lemovicicum TaxID=1072463 RepID=A0A3S9WDE4_9MICO|nr:hypothetical protein [Microbacterium lemovicicum]AZS38040.1 hypothetical protein CVS47_02690 [Microbacterium lemovicicum]